jgi:hypothetical protein
MAALLSFRQERPDEHGFAGSRRHLHDAIRLRGCWGQYCNLEMAVRTFLLVSADTLLTPFATRDTVVVPTPASFATSFIVIDIRLGPKNGKVYW